MKSFNEYMEVISKNCLDLKKDDNVFIVLPSEMKYLKYHVISYLNSNGITNITVYLLALLPLLLFLPTFKEVGSL